MLNARAGRVPGVHRLDAQSLRSGHSGCKLLEDDGTGNDINGNPKPSTRSGLKFVYAGAAAARYFGVDVDDPRVPDVYATAQHGVVFTGGRGKIAEHGGADPQDRNVPLVISGGQVRKAAAPRHRPRPLDRT